MFLKITIPEMELYNDLTGEFYSISETTLTLKHSLLSVSKWEAKWKKPFLNSSTDEMTSEELADYIRCMTVTQNVNENVYKYIPEYVKQQVAAYIQDTMTATWFSEKDKSAPKGDREIVTSELIYYWMTQFNIPFECEKWHLNRLLTLIRICSIKNQPSKKMKGTELAKYNNQLNKARRMKHKTRG